MNSHVPVLGKGKEQKAIAVSKYYCVVFSQDVECYMEPRNGPPHHLAEVNLKLICKAAVGVFMFIFPVSKRM